MAANVYAQLVGLAAGLLLLSGVLLVWRRSMVASVRLLSVQGAALGALVAVIGVQRREVELLAVAGLVVLLKGAVLPVLVARSVPTDAVREESPRLNPTAALIAAAALTVVAYLVSRPIVGSSTDPAVLAVPVALALMLLGFLLLVGRRHALAQLVGFLVLDNGIAAVAFMTAGGLPLVVELGASLDVLLVVLILQVFSARMRVKFGALDLDELTELRD
jgi:hydrogenase-4 component E